jgi:hypothetical protein
MLIAALDASIHAFSRHDDQPSSARRVFTHSVRVCIFIMRHCHALCPSISPTKGVDMSLVKHSFGDGPTRSSHLRCLRPLPIPRAHCVLLRTMWLRPFTDQLHPLCSSTGQASAPLEQMASAPSQINCTPVQFVWAGKRATRVGRALRRLFTAYLGRQASFPQVE